MERNVEIRPMSLEQFTDWLVGVILQFFYLLQQISVPIFLVMFGLGGIVLIVGMLFGSSRMRGAGGGTLIMAIFGFILVWLAPTIVQILEDLVSTAP
ncbi:hypothetical protein GCM10010965_14780 [Caldalkalibacillus thermarum]|uniref:pilin n=1 Tax=Caldalkalibacillus thermarum TaxID=296745 RepID=UPI00166557B0|nr:pilin [Caldalkalibacillus thermarum]GGK22954.1 hypothetical protein GCM10010965_14780 [Caldalkalibacillus thermarum]